MGKVEKTFAIFYLVYMAAYLLAILGFFLAPVSGMSLPGWWSKGVFPMHLFGMLVWLAMFVITIRDLYKRSFPNVNSKITWVILILWWHHIALVAYLFMHGFKPRSRSTRPKAGLGAPEMTRLDKAFAIFCLVHTVLYASTIAWLGLSGAMGKMDGLIFEMHHGLWTALTFVFIVLAFRDLYRREFPDPNSKLTWALIMMLTLPVGVFVYVFKHRFRPRAAAEGADEAKKKEPRGDRPCP